VYNAGTDCLAGDPLGQLDVSAAGIVARDECVFDAAQRAKVPVVMLLSGGYQKSNAAVIADSIVNLNEKFKLIDTAIRQLPASQPPAAATDGKNNAGAAVSAAAADVKAPVSGAAATVMAAPAAAPAPALTSVAAPAANAAIQRADNAAAAAMDSAPPVAPARM
jgi:hypothetical protein